MCKGHNYHDSFSQEYPPTDFEKVSIMLRHEKESDSLLDDMDDIAIVDDLYCPLCSSKLTTQVSKIYTY